MDVDSKDGSAISDGTSLLASQNTAVSQKRQKKPTAPQVLQRMRPISKRKKFKKSLGPDFLEPAELGMQYLRDTYEPKCDICSLTMTVSSSTSVYVSEELLHCNNCDAKAHPSCVNMNEEVAHKTQWQCHNCKICSVCRKNELNEFLIICFSCSKGYHPKCHTNPIINKPKGHWYCENCCSRGSHSYQSNGINDKKAAETSEESSQSEDNETEETPKASFRLVVEPEDNSESNDQNKDNSNELSDDLKDETIIKEENEFKVNQKDSEVIKISNGIESSVKEEATEENGNGVDHKNNNQESQNSDTNQSNPSVSPQKWSVEEVETFIREAGFPTESLIFREQEIDGRSLLLLRRMDVLTGLSLKLGPALKIYNHISRLQSRESNDNSNRC